MSMLFSKARPSSSCVANTIAQLSPATSVASSNNNHSKSTQLTTIKQPAASISTSSLQTIRSATSLKAVASSTSSLSSCKQSQFACEIKVPSSNNEIDNLIAKTFSSSASTAAANADIFGAHDTFIHRHIGPTEQDVAHMLKVLNVASLDALVDATVPPNIRSKKALTIGEPRGEQELLQEFKGIMKQNQLNRSHIGMGYYGTITPPVILRNILENPGWYTPYTPYSAEIAQGRMEMLLNFQTMICDLTGLPIANASLLDEATAAAEAMNLCINSFDKKKSVFYVSNDVHPQTRAVIETRARGISIDVRSLDIADMDFSKGDVAGVLIQYPNTYGSLQDYREFVKKVHAGDARVVVASDLLALTLLTPPGEWDADVVIGSAQRFGVPFGFGGPHAAFFATKDEHKRKIPGRIIGISRDSHGNHALRMAMQTREQHIRRDKATSNICTAQALLANISAAYGMYHGPKGLKKIATKVHAAAKTFATGVQKLGYQVAHKNFFDTVVVMVNHEAALLAHSAAKQGINLRVINSNEVGISFDETTRADHIDDLFKVFANHGNKGQALNFTASSLVSSVDIQVPEGMRRQSSFMTHPAFNSYHCETEMMRYLYKLQSRDLSLQTAMIPLGSCTMKLNAAVEMYPVTWPEVNSIHPFAPTDQTIGYQKMLAGLAKDLCEITGFDAISFQPNAGSQGEYAGLVVIDAYHKSRGDHQRDVCLIPTSAHGTNPASAVMAGMKVVVVECDNNGNVDLKDLKAKAEEYKNSLAALMITYPSTHGVFEEGVQEAIKIIHQNGGQVYMDGANMNAQVGLTSPGFIGADVCHLNLHKTFCIPHGGGGPGMGPIGVKKHLIPFLPGNPVVNSGGEKSAGSVSAAPFSSASILPISWMYIRLMGGKGLTQATKVAILSANYMAARLKDHYKILYRGKNGFVAHEFIIDLRPIKASTGITEEDVAKRLMDYNFHAPTMSWPVVGTLMVEPTESESLYELDRFCDAMIKIREEIREIEQGKADKLNNVLRGAPHTPTAVLSDKWNKPYSREQAAYPLSYLKTNKFWPTIGRIDNVYGDRNLVCSCPPLSSYK